jgi:hypothetical protein
MAAWLSWWTTDQSARFGSCRLRTIGCTGWNLVRWTGATLPSGPVSFPQPLGAAALSALGDRMVMTSPTFEGYPRLLGR